MTLKDLVPKNLGKKLLPVRRREEDDPFTRLHREMNRMFDDFSRGFGLTSNFWRSPFDMLEGGTAGAWTPTVDVAETDKEIKVTAELPGMDEKDVNVELSDGMLTISGEKKSEREEKAKNVYRRERSYGSFHRSLSLPAEVEKDKVEATFKKGVLTVTLPKSASAISHIKKIDVKPE
jgi:HSP20 family protein